MNLETRVLFFVRGSDRPLTRKEIASGLGLSKSPALIRALESLVSQGLMTTTTDNSVYPTRFLYEVKR